MSEKYYGRVKKVWYVCQKGQHVLCGETEAVEEILYICSCFCHNRDYSSEGQSHA